ncbi:MAG: ABC transporter transmembrane domain-containing protein, partial [Cyanobacteria bacterium J06631_12]
MTYTDVSLAQSIGEVYPFDQLPATALEQLAQGAQQLRYRIGQPILRRETMPHQIIVITKGRGRLLGYDPYKKAPMTLSLLEPKAVLGLASLVRGVPCEGAIASSEIDAITLPISTVRQLMGQHEPFAQAVTNTCYLSEVFDLASQYFQTQARTVTDLSGTARQLQSDAQAITLRAGNITLQAPDPNQLWFVSSESISSHPAGSWLLPEMLDGRITSQKNTRLVGIDMRQLATQRATASSQQNGLESPPLQDYPPSGSPTSSSQNGGQNGAQNGTALSVRPAGDVPYAPELTFDANLVEAGTERAKAIKYPVMRGRGDVGSSLASFAMIAQHLGMPFKRDVVQRVLNNQRERLGHLSLTACGAVADLVGLKPQLAKIPASAIARLPKLAIINWREGFAVIYETSQNEYVLGVPEENKLVRHSPQAFEEIWGTEGEILLVETTEQTPQQKFGLGWFIPSLKKYRGVLSLVLVASLFVQVFGLANPLMVQVIIDRVISRNSPDTLHVLGIFLVIVAVFEAILTSLRTYLFVDTTNRIDMALGAEIIDHLLRLPLRYFDRRPVGELSSRVNELHVLCFYRLDTRECFHQK